LKVKGTLVDEAAAMSVWGGRAPVRAALYMGAGRDQAQRGDPRLLSPLDRGGQTEEGRAHRVHAQAPHDSERYHADEHDDLATASPSSWLKSRADVN
jgi:hypothetical protein